MDTMPTLTFNDIARHQSKMVNTKVVSKLSPWFSKVELGEEFTNFQYHMEKERFIASDIVEELIKTGK